MTRLGTAPTGWVPRGADLPPGKAFESSAVKRVAIAGAVCGGRAGRNRLGLEIDHQLAETAESRVNPNLGEIAV